MFFIHTNVKESTFAKTVIIKVTDEDLGLVQNVRFRHNCKHNQR
jgi:hypothetical protein